MASNLRRDHAERLKELDCLRGIAELFAAPKRTLERTLRDAAALVIRGWRYPERACVRIRLMGLDIRTSGHERCTRRMRRPIRSGSRVSGLIEVAYPDLGRRGDPFLESEGPLLHAVSVLLGTMAELSRVRDDLERRAAELRAGKTALQRKNIALGEVLDHLEDEKRAQARMLRNTVEGVLLPAVSRLRRAAPSPAVHRHTIELIEGHLKSLASSGPDPGVDRLAVRLSPREIEVADLVRIGLSSKEIGVHLGVAQATIERHRHNIRSKLGMGRSNASLPTRLSGI